MAIGLREPAAVEQSSGRVFSLVPRRHRVDDRIHVRLAAGLAALPGVIKAGVAEHDEREILVAFDPHAAQARDLLKVAIESAADVVGFQRNRRHLDEAFLDLTQPGVRA